MANEWISVNDRQPDDGQTVLVSRSSNVWAAEFRMPFDDCGTDKPWWMLFKGPNWPPLYPHEEWVNGDTVQDCDVWQPMPRPNGCATEGE